MVFKFPVLCFPSQRWVCLQQRGFAPTAAFHRRGRRKSVESSLMHNKTRRLTRRETNLCCSNQSAASRSSFYCLCNRSKYLLEFKRRSKYAETTNGSNSCWRRPPRVWPDEAVLGRDGLLEELELVQVEDYQVAGAEDGHEDAHAAEDERVEGPAQGPPGAQEQEDGEVNKRSQRGQHDPCRNKNTTETFFCIWS